MDAIIQCAGRGTRLRPLTDTVPKPLIPVAGKGTLPRTLDILPPDVTRVILVVGHLADAIKERIGTTSHGRAVAYVTQDPLDGTGGCLRRVLRDVPDLSERFLVMYGDDLYAEKDFTAIVQSPSCALLGLPVVAKGNDTKDAWKADADGKLLELFRPSPGDHVWMNVGVYLLDHSWFKTDPVLVPGKTSEYSLPHAIPQMIERGIEIRAIPATFWMPVGTPEELQAAENMLLNADAGTPLRR